MGFSVILETTFVRYVLACTSPVAVRLQYVRLRHGLRYRQRGGDRLILTVVLPGSCLNIRARNGLRDDCAQPHGSLEPFERLVDRIQRDGPPDEATERKPAGGVEACESREVYRGHTAAVVAAEYAFALIC